MLIRFVKSCSRKYLTHTHTQFGLSFEIAGIVGAVFGLMNIGSRSIGGFSSDLLGKHFGMRGRLWAYFLLQVQ